MSGNEHEMAGSPPGDESWTTVLTDLAPGEIRDLTVPSRSGRSGSGPSGSGPSDSGGEMDLVAWRDRSGRPCVMAARCPHQWSHLGAEGVLDGDEIVCSAHFWRFDRSGTGTKLNVKGRRDPKADIEVLPVREYDGAIQIPLEPG